MLREKDLHDSFKCYKTNPNKPGFERMKPLLKIFNFY